MAKRKTLFYAFPSDPPSTAECIHKAIVAIKSTRMAREQNIRFRPWPEMAVGGKALISTITENINRADIFACDLTQPNFNVTFELGFAIGTFKRIWISLNEAVQLAPQNYRRVYSGIVGGLGYGGYTNHENLATTLESESPWADPAATPLGAQYRRQVSRRERPTLLFVKPPIETEAVITAAQTIAASYFGDGLILDDPKEDPSPELSWYADKIMVSDAVLIQLLAENERGAYDHAMRCSFVAGLSYAFGKDILIVVPGPYDPPADYQDLLRVHDTSQQCQNQINGWISKLEQSISRGRPRRPSERTRGSTNLDLRSLSVGEPVAENEHSSLDDYFLETGSFFRALEGPTAILVGRRGTGKTASLYGLQTSIGEDRRNHVCVIKPVGYEIDGLIRVLNENIDRSERGYLIESLWKFLIFSELALSVYDELTSKPPYLNRTAEERAFTDFVGSRQGSLSTPFSERLDRAVSGLIGIGDLTNSSDQRVRISELLHSGEIRELRQHLGAVLASRNRVAILVDNLDAPWEQGHDIERLSELLLGLLRVLDDISDEFQHEDYWRKPVNCSITVFLRSDIFSLIQPRAAEQDKLPVERLYWDSGLLLKMLNQRFEYAFEPHFVAKDVWEHLFPKEIVGLPTSEFLCATVLPRPRDIIYLVRSAIATAVNRGDSSVKSDDFLIARNRYSEWVFRSVLAEDDPSRGKLEEVLYEFAGAPRIVSLGDIKARMVSAGVLPSDHDFYIDLLCDISFLGIPTAGGTYSYSRDEGNRQMLRQVAKRIGVDSDLGEESYEVNVAFHQVLQID